MEPKFLHYLVDESEGAVVAHCLDYDLVVAADTQKEAIRRLHFLVRCHVETSRKKCTPSALYHRAPDEYWEKFSSIQQQNLQMLKMQISGDRSEEQDFQVGVLAASSSPASYAIQ